MVYEVFKVLHHDLLENIQVSDQNVGLLTNIKAELYTNIELMMY